MHIDPIWCIIYLFETRSEKPPPTNGSLGGGFKYVLCSPLFGEDSQFDSPTSSASTWFFDGQQQLPAQLVIANTTKFTGLHKQKRWFLKDAYMAKTDNTFQVFQFVTFSSPTLGPQNHEKWRFYTPKYGLYTLKMKVLGSHGSWRSLNPFKGSLNHPKKGHFQSPGSYVHSGVCFTMMFF